MNPYSPSSGVERQTPSLLPVRDHRPDDARHARASYPPRRLLNTPGLRDLERDIPNVLPDVIAGLGRYRRRLAVDPDAREDGNHVLAVLAYHRAVNHARMDTE